LKILKINGDLSTILQAEVLQPILLGISSQIKTQQIDMPGYS